jgi:methionine sulfoxide reductase catalytic subunit
MPKVSAHQQTTPDPGLAGMTGSPDVLAGYRDRLTKGEDAIDPDRWAGSLPAAYGVPPRIRIGSSRWFNLLWLLPIGFVLLIVAVAGAQGLRHVPAVAGFIARYPGTAVPTSARAHPGLPVGVAVTHFLNLLLMVFIIRSGIQILADHPRLYWTRHSTPGQGLVPVPTAGSRGPAVDRQAGLGHLAQASRPAWPPPLDWAGTLVAPRHGHAVARQRHCVLHAAIRDGAVAAGRAHLLVGVPNAASVLIQYLSLQWPKESAWIAYNGLQQLAYFVTIFIAAPLLRPGNGVAGGTRGA